MEEYKTAPCAACGSIVEVVFILMLNDMRYMRVEDVVPVAKAKTPEALLRWLESEKVDSYTEIVDGRTWGKTFRKGGPLEWFNPPFAPHPVMTAAKNMCDGLREV